MSVPRRAVLRGSLALSATALTPWATATARAADQPAPGPRRPSAHARYPVNRQPLLAESYLRLPPGSVRPRGWIATQLDRQLDGLNGNLARLSAYCSFDSTGWIHPDRPGWEEVPYWLRGYGDLAYTTGDETALAETQRWLEGVLATRAPDGFFGPTALRTALEGGYDFWPHMPMIRALRSWAEYHGDTDIDAVLLAFYHLMDAQPASVFQLGWGTYRWADTLDTLVWLYNRTGEGFLLDLMRKAHTHGADYSADTLPTLHNVNLAQGFREPALYGLLSGEQSDRQATYDVYATVTDTWGQFPGGGFAGDENARRLTGDPRQGFETCGITELMTSQEILHRMTGDVLWADHTENLAFNSLPAALDPLGRGVHYITSANAVSLDRGIKTRGQFQNFDFAMLAYKPGHEEIPGGYRCCSHNYGTGWPFYAEEMWAATPDGGLAAVLHGPSQVTAEVRGGVRATLTSDTGYPFDDTVTLTVELPRPTTFPLHLRIPGWCAAPTLTVAGEAVPVAAGPGHAVVDRLWRGGERVVLRLPMDTSVRTWEKQHGAVSVERGPLSYSLRIGEEWRNFGGDADWPHQEVLPTTPWNYALDLDADDPAGSLEVTTGGGEVDDPFTPGTAPVTITAPGRRVPGWRADDEGVVTPLQDSPVRSAEPAEDLTLIPMGAARLRISAFPRIGGEADWAPAGQRYRLVNGNSGHALGIDGDTDASGAALVQRADGDAADLRWVLVPAGDAAFRLVNARSGRALALRDGQAEQVDDTGAPELAWEVVSGAEGWLRLRSGDTVLAVAGASTAVGARAVGAVADPAAADQNWLLVPDGEVRLGNVHSAKVADVEGISLEDGALVWQWTDFGTGNQRWLFTPTGDGWLTLTAVHSGRLVSVVGASTEDGADLEQRGADGERGAAHQHWRLVPLADGSHQLVNRHSGRLMAVHQMSTEDAGHLQQHRDTGTPDQRWYLG